MENIALVEKKLTQLGIPSDIRANITARLLANRDKKLSELTNFKSEFIAQIKSLHNDGYGFNGFMALLYLLNILAFIDLIISTIFYLTKGDQKPILFMFGGGIWLFVSLSIMGLTALNRTVRDIKGYEQEKNIINTNCEQAITALYTNPVVFLKEAIEYCQVELSNFNSKIGQAWAEFKTAVTDPKDHYASQKQQCEEDIKQLEASDPEEIPSLDLALAARKFDLDFFTRKLDEKMPQEQEIEAKIASLENRSEGIKNQIEQLVALKTRCESINEIINRACHGMSAEQFEELIEQNKTRQLDNIAVILDELEEDMGFMSTGIEQIFQSIPEPEQLPVNTPSLRLVA